VLTLRYKKQLCSTRRSSAKAGLIRAPALRMRAAAGLVLFSRTTHEDLRPQTRFSVGVGVFPAKKIVRAASPRSQRSAHNVAFGSRRRRLQNRNYLTRARRRGDFLMRGAGLRPPLRQLRKSWHSVFLVAGPRHARVPEDARLRPQFGFSIERPRGYDYFPPTTRVMGQRRSALSAECSRETARTRQIEAHNEILAGGPVEVRRGDVQVRGVSAPGGFATAPAMTMREPEERRTYLVSNGSAKAASLKNFVGHGR
jgi:hypothetical protein